METNQLPEDFLIRGAIDDEMIMSILADDCEKTIDNAKKEKYLIPFRPRSSSDSSVEENTEYHEHNVDISEQVDKNSLLDDEDSDKMNDYQTLSNLDDDGDDFGENFSSNDQKMEFISNSLIPTSTIVENSLGSNTLESTSTIVFEQFADFDSISLPPINPPPSISIPPFSPGMLYALNNRNR
jgi:hypothetical protein